MTTRQKSSKHTTGPWIARQEFSNRWRIEAPKEGFIPISVGLACTTILEVGSGSDSTTEYNAYLMASAPDLLKACKEIASKSLNYHDNAKFAGQNHDMMNYAHICDVLVSAISKAEGL